jgi:hypothetical protein
MPADDVPAPRSLPKRVADAALRPVADPMRRRFDLLEARIDGCERLLLEVRDRVEADLASIVELTVELQRTLDELKRERDDATSS